METEIPRIPAAEWEVMEVLWNEPGLTGTEVHQRLPRQDRKLKTVNTLLARLVERGVLATRRVGKAFRYTPLLEREACVRQESAGFVQRILGGQWSPLVLQLVEQANLSPSDIAELEALLQAKKQTQQRRKR